MENDQNSLLMRIEQFIVPSLLASLVPVIRHEPRIGQASTGNIQPE